MKKLLSPEIAFGFLIATMLWIGVLGWQASYAPTDSEKRQCEEAATKSGHKAEECKTLWERTTSDPVAFFTFWLVISTVGLGVSTVMLWRAGEKQFLHARRSVAIQSRDMRESIKASTAAAMAADRSAEVAEKALIATDRAWISISAEIVGPLIFHAYNAEISLRIAMTNVGKSPATHVDLHVQLCVDIMHARTVGVSSIKIGSLPAFGFGIVLFPGESSPWREIRAQMDVAKFKALNTEPGATRDEDPVVVAGRPAIMAHAKYRLAASDALHHTVIISELRHIDADHPGWDGDRDETPPDCLKLVQTLFSGQVS